MQKEKVKIAVVGCGEICKRTYMENLVRKFNIVDVAGCCDLIEERSASMAERYGIRQLTNEQIWNDPAIEIVVNLTFPEAHYQVNKAALLAGKHVYVEKMMCSTFEESTEVLALARQKKLMLCAAPDTFLGAWTQSACKYISDGLIGTPVAVNAVMARSYQPDTAYFDLSPDSYYFTLHRGGGFPYDWGGYFLHAMIQMLGELSQVTGFGGNLYPERTFTHPRHPRYGDTFYVDTPTSLFAALEFASGAHGTFMVTSDASAAERFEVIGTNGTLVLGNPNFFSDTVVLRRSGILPVSQTQSDSVVEPKRTQLGERPTIAEMPLPLLHGYGDASRGIGVADMCYALRNHRKPRLDAQLGYHAMEVIHGILTSAETGERYRMRSHCERPKPLRPSALTGTAQEAILDD